MKSPDGSPSTSSFAFLFAIARGEGSPVYALGLDLAQSGEKGRGDPPELGPEQLLAREGGGRDELEGEDEGEGGETRRGEVR